LANNPFGALMLVLSVLGGVLIHNPLFAVVSHCSSQHISLCGALLEVFNVGSEGLRGLWCVLTCSDGIWWRWLRITWSFCCTTYEKVV